jgi:predicted anti-sigma-YlaC factor YlaD
MNCRTSRRLMHLDRPGERTERETAELREHLNGCPSCSAEASRLRQLAQVEQRLRTATIPVPELSDVKARVLLATSPPIRRRPVKPRALRIVYAFAVVAVLAWFGVEQWRMRTSHAALVGRSPRPSTSSLGPQIVYSVDAQEARTLVANGASLPPGVPASGALEVSQATASEWIESAPAFLLRTLVRRPDREARVVEALRCLESVVEVTIRFRPKGA